MVTAEQHQPPTRQVRRSEEYVAPGPDDADQGPVPPEPPDPDGEESA